MPQINRGNLQTFAQALEGVKKQDWGHDWPVRSNDEFFYGASPTCRICGGEKTLSSVVSWCPVRIARAQQAAVAKALRYIAQQLGPCDLNKIAAVLEEAADAIEQELEGKRK